MSDATIRTSVIIPVYNTEDYLEECLDSVLAQTQREIEVILVDDGSTDSSPEIERRYAERDPRVRVITQENQRQGAARNRGLEVARGEYVYFMDSDDFIVPTHFEECYRACEKDSLDFVTFDTAGFTDDPYEEHPELFPEICDRSGTIASEVVDGITFWHTYQPLGMLPFICWMEYFRRGFLVDNDLQFFEGIYFEDNDWIARIYMEAQRVAYLPLKLHRYRHRPGSNVHAGFTHVLAESCFDVHYILCDLARHEQDLRRLKIIETVSFVKDFRFEQFVRLEPTDKLRTMICDFTERTNRDFHDIALSDTLRRMHFHALVKLHSGVLSWPNPPLSCDERSLAGLICATAPSASEAPRVGIYGTGKACKAFTEYYDLGNRTCFFIETETAPGQTFKGNPVYGISTAANLHLDAVFITSEKYADEMKANVVRYLGEDMAIYVVPKLILALEDKDLLLRLRHPRLRRAWRMVKAAVHKQS